MEIIRTNSFRAWLLASRPKTLICAIIPVLVALSVVYTESKIHYFVFPMDIRWIPAVLCLLFAILMQIDANLVNDYIDCRRGIDNENRIGPARACANGYVTMPAMRRAIAVVTLLSCAVGLPLVAWGGWGMLLVGVACVAFCFLYSVVFSRWALGDVLVIVFFGIVPVCTTYYIQMLEPAGRDVILISVSLGLVIDSLLVVNNYRDRYTDRLAGKRTLATVLGDKGIIIFHLFLAGIPIFLLFDVLGDLDFIMTLWMLGHASITYYMVFFNEKEDLDKVLKWTLVDILVFAVLLCVLYHIHSCSSVKSYMSI